MLKAQLEILKAVAAGHPLPQVLDLIAQAKEQLLPDERCAICLIDTDRVTLLDGASPSLPPQLSNALHHLQLADEAGSRHPLDPREHPSWQPYRDVIQAHGLAIGRAEPIVTARGEVAGYAMSLVAGEARPLSDQESHWLRVWAELTLVALRHAQVDESLQMSEVRLAAVIENSPALIAMSDTAGRYVLANRAVQEVLGVSPQDLLGSDARAAFGDEAAEVVTALQRRVMETLIPLQEEVVVAGRWLRVVSFPVRTPRGTPYAVGVVGIDVTENKKNQERLRLAAMTEAAGRTAGGIVHDFNNILTGIAIAADAGENQDAETGALREALRDIRSFVSRAATLTDRLRSISGPATSPIPEAVDVNDLVESLSPLLDAAAQGKSTVELDLARELPPVLIDPTELERALVNLVINAADAIDPDGKIVVTTRAPADGAEVTISVTDNGHGMEEATAQKVFEPFFTTKPPGGGLGLGLAVVQGIAVAAGGRVAIESKMEAGTTVNLYVPAMT